MNALEVDYRPMQLLYRELPRDGRWTTVRRDKWLAAVKATIELLTETMDEETT